MHALASTVLYTLRRAPRGPDVARHSGQSLADVVSLGSLDAVTSCSTSGPVRPSVRLESLAPVATLKTTAQLLGLSGFVRELAYVVPNLSAAAALQRCVCGQYELCLAVEQLGVLVDVCRLGLEQSRVQDFPTERGHVHSAQLSKAVRHWDWRYWRHAESARDHVVIGEADRRYRQLRHQSAADVIVSSKKSKKSKKASKCGR